MTTDQKDSLKLRHILEASEHIVDFLAGVTQEQFEADYEKQSAVIRQFEIIGEAASKLSIELINQHQEIDWPKVVGMRHKMIHDYFDVDVSIVWATAKDDILLLRGLVGKILGTV